MMDPLKGINTRTTVQTVQARPDQVKNNAGGYVFEVKAEDRIRRFLTLGTDGTYYTGAKELTLDNAKVILDWAMNRPVDLVDIVVQVSEAGRAPKNNPALLALAAAAASGDAEGRAYALASLNKVARTGTHLFQFATYVQQFRGWGRGLRRAVAGWYESRSVEDVAYQLLKYRQREGWTHRDLLRLSHPDPKTSTMDALYRYAVKGYAGTNVQERLELPPLVHAFEVAQTANIPKIIDMIGHLPVSWEMLPTEALASPEVWKALILKGMPATALMRQLPRLTRLGVLDDPETRAKVVADLTDAGRLRKGRVHPVNVLIAQRTYASGQSARGDGTWAPNRHITDALDAAFYAAFGTVEPAGKRTLIGLDVSGSMGAQISGLPITAREASTALAMVQVATEPETHVVAFTSNNGSYYSGHRTSLTGLDLSNRRRLDDVCRAASQIPFGGTDCALPMIWAMQQGHKYETFIIYTDNETWAGQIHPHQALRQYRETTGIDAKLIVVGMTSTGFTIADPSDPGMLDVAGFDSAVPSLISDFSRGL
jgi:60 kDa SS-A/Ro ribonucleoprotein